MTITPDDGAVRVKRVLLCLLPLRPKAGIADPTAPEDVQWHNFRPTHEEVRRGWQPEIQIELDASPLAIQIVELRSNRGDRLGLSFRREDYQGMILNVSASVATSWIRGPAETLTLEVKAGDAKDLLHPTDEELRAFKTYVISNIPIPK